MSASRRGVRGLAKWMYDKGRDPSIWRDHDPTMPPEPQPDELVKLNRSRVDSGQTPISMEAWRNSKKIPPEILGLRELWGKRDKPRKGLDEFFVRPDEADKCGQGPYLVGRVPHVSEDLILPAPTEIMKQVAENFSREWPGLKDQAEEMELWVTQGQYNKKMDQEGDRSDQISLDTVSYTHLTLPTTPYV